MREHIILTMHSEGRCLIWKLLICSLGFLNFISYLQKVNTLINLVLYNLQSFAERVFWQRMLFKWYFNSLNFDYY